MWLLKYESMKQLWINFIVVNLLRNLIMAEQLITDKQCETTYNELESTWLGPKYLTFPATQIAHDISKMSHAKIPNCTFHSWVSWDVTKH